MRRHRPRPTARDLALLCALLASVGLVVAVTSSRTSTASADTGGGTAGEYHPIAYARIVNTTNGLGTCTLSPCDKIPAAGTLTIQVAGKGGVPTSGVSAVVLNVTTLNVAGNGYANVYAHGASKPDGRSLTLTTGTTMSNVAITGVSSDGEVDIYASQATDVLVDVSGWYDTPDAGSGSGFYPLNGPRILDTRNGTGICTPSPCASIPSGGTLTLQVGGQGGVPASGVSAVALTVTELNSTTSGFVQVWPAGGTQPVGRNLSYNGTGVSELSVTPLSAAGQVSIYSSSSSINVLVDVAGYYTTSQDGTGQVFVPAGADQRILDTRNGTGSCMPAPCATLPSNSNVTVDVPGNAGAPAGASAVVLNATVFNPSADGALVIWNADDTQPPGRNLSYSAGKSASNTAIVALGPAGAVNVRAINNSTDLTLDVEGYFYDDKPAMPTVTSSPSDSQSLNPSWTFTTVSGTSTQCELDNGDGLVISPRASCTSPVSFDLTGQPDDVYEFSVYAVDATGDLSDPAGTEFRLDRPCTNLAVTATQIAASQPVGAEVSAQAHVTDQCFGGDASGVSLNYTVRGTQSLSGSAVSDDNGDAYLTISGATAGQDTVTFTAPHASTAQATITWTGTTTVSAPQTTCDLVPLSSDGRVLPSSCDTDSAPADPLDGLVAATDGPCAGMYELQTANVCVHGADTVTLPAETAPPEPPGLTTPTTSDATAESAYDQATDSDYAAATAPASDPLSSTASAELATANQADALCRGDGTSGYRVQAVYAVAADRASRYLRIRDVLRNYAHRANNTYYRSSASNYPRKIRFVCNSSAQIAVAKLVVPATAGRSLGKLLDWLRNTSGSPQAPAFMRRKDRKYMIWLDRVNPTNYCGLGESDEDRRKSPPELNAAEWGYDPGYTGTWQSPAYGVTYLLECAGAPESSSAFEGNAEAHELAHNLGAVNWYAPHGTKNGHCYEEHDDLCYDDDTTPNDNIATTLNGPQAFIYRTDCPSFPYENRLDCHHNDYFNSRHHLTGYLARWWNVADSRFLIGPR